MFIQIVGANLDCPINLIGRGSRILILDMLCQLLFLRCIQAHSWLNENSCKECLLPFPSLSLSSVFTSTPSPIHHDRLSDAESLNFVSRVLENSWNSVESHVLRLPTDLLLFFCLVLGVANIKCENCTLTQSVIISYMHFILHSLYVTAAITSAGPLQHPSLFVRLWAVACIAYA